MDMTNFGYVVRIVVSSIAIFVQTNVIFISVEL